MFVYVNYDDSHKLEYLAVYGRASMVVPVGDVHIFKWHSAGWPRARMVDCGWRFGLRRNKIFLSRTET